MTPTNRNPVWWPQRRQRPHAPGVFRGIASVIAIWLLMWATCAAWIVPDDAVRVAGEACGSYAQRVRGVLP